MRRKLRRHFAFLMAVLMMLSLMGVQVLAEGVQVEAVQTTEGTDCTVLPEETDAEETSRSEMQKPGAKESPPESGVVTEEGKSTDSEKISVVLKDEILTKGSLTAEVSGTTESDQIAYQWQVSEKGQWKDIEDTATVDSRKQSYEVARDGAQKTFRVKVTVNEAVTVYSSEYKVNYYDKLQNGSFETPKVSDAGTLTYKDAHFIQVANGTNNLYWKTTAKGAYFGAGNQKDYYIEIADGSRSYYGNTVNDPKPVYNISSAAQENQFAELNCEEPGALYQDVLTEPGTVLHWGLEHAGRWGTDTMAVIISDTKSINSCLYASISYKTSVFIGFSRPYFLFLSPTTPFLHHFTLNYTFSRTFPFPRTACPLLRGNTSPLSFVMCHVPKVSAMFWGSCHIRLLL